MTTTFTLNGVEVSVQDKHPHLLAALREELHVISPKDGCAPSGQCGCCTVLVDGKARVACQTPLDKTAGAQVVTLEGIDEDEKARYTKAFASHGALQCGFCTPGIVMRAKALIDRKGAELTRDETCRHLGGHLCRCTGYVKILDAVHDLSQGTVCEPETPGGVGSSGVKYEATDLAAGQRPYIDDIFLPDMLHAAVHLTAHARADIKRINTEPAEAVPGVVAVFTAADVPGDLRVGLIHKDWPVFIPEGGRTSYRGDVLALVVAVDVQTAREAAQLIEVDYEPLIPYSDPVVAAGLAPAPTPDSNGSAVLANGVAPEDAVWELDGNILSRSAYKRGDVETALEASAHTVQETFQTQRVEHAFLEPESTLAVPSSNGSGPSTSATNINASAPMDPARDTLMVYSGGQGVWDDRNQIAAVLDIPPSQVTVELISNGGAFGGKEDMSNQAQTALAAWLLGKPVKCTLTREESLLMHPKRHPIRMEYTAGCDEEGKLTALHVRMVGDSGPYASVGMKVLERAAGHASGPYMLPTIDVEALAVRTNNPVCGAFRGFGANQAQFAMEGVMDRLAEAVGISGWEIRSRNVIMPGLVWGPGQIMDEGCLGARACLDEVKEQYDAAKAAGKPVGLGLGLKNSGLGNGFKEIARAVVRFAEDGSVEVRHCWTEMGQGIHTVALQVAVQELGVDPDRIKVIVDTTRELGAGQTTGSRGTLMGAGSVAEACKAAVSDGCKPGVDYQGEYIVDWTNSLEEGVENPIIHSTFGYAAQMIVLDSESGEVEQVIAAHDVGKAVNPQLCQGQIEGAVHMGLGYALSEGFPVDEDSTPTNDTFRSLGIIRPKDMPDVEVKLVECAQPNAPYGIKGVGEIGLVPTAGAVAAALHDLDGNWHTHLPMKAPEQQDVWQAPVLVATPA